MFEHKHQPLIPLREFLLRLLRYFLFSSVILGFSLFLGMFGYHHLAGLSWIDSLLNASMILTGMGPVDQMQTNAAKVFASFYALYSGVVFLSTIALLLAPAVHRFMHILHLESGKD